MYKNPGRRIRRLATILCVLGFMVWCVAGISVLFFGVASGGSTYSVITGILMIAVGCLISWLSSLWLAGYGELIESSAKTAEECEKIAAESKRSVEARKRTADAQKRTADALEALLRESRDAR